MFSIYNNGKPSPMGYSQTRENGLKISNFALFSSAADAVELCLFRDGKESCFAMSRTDNIWHVAIEGVELNDEYAFRITGKNDRTLANPQKLMLDPYAKAVTHKPDLSSLEARSIFLLNDERDNAAVAPKGRIVDEYFDWSGDCKPSIPWAQTIVYELNVKGFSQLNSRIPENIRGTYAALAHPENIAYFKSLGITSLELLPVNFFIDEPHLQEKGLRNYWGYNPLAIFALEPSYAADQKHPLNEFKSMVKALHQAGIEVILDVVFNHTAESEKSFPTFCQRGIDDKTYYWQNEHGDYINWTGCGNMLNLANDVTRKWVLDCLRYWVTECHVDGFRFDLATVLGRETPDFNPNAQLFAEMEQDDVLQQIKLIAEPWDIGYYGYQVGYFPAYFSQWNDRFRDDMCRFWLWQSGEVGAFAERFAGSSDIFKREGRLPHGSLNFITAHDGFTLRDLVSYNHKHNDANGEENRDGRNENYSYNHGIEGSQLDLADECQSAVEKRRVLSEKALLGSLLLSNGVPMLLAGDEFGNTQYGNNNGYCQDNEITWLKWDNFNQTLFDFTKQTIVLRKKIQSLQQGAWWSDENVEWLNTGGNPMTLDDWHNRESKALQVMLDGKYLFLINAKTEPQSFYLPKGKWKKIAETENSVIQQCDVSGIAFEVLEHMDDENDGVCYEK
ncbi:glycogen debranching protein GlgX [Haemophilus parainfluenzae]|jgi:glycogen debranching enzyme glgX|uniref:glycogen debranching protein GlgX n=1 Tax=Haemophilus parainfluenzae TaxID=729 RepID=UPI0008038037|nr:glycogen debranching protein GlgX [Haemophilus parainfluenzae]MDU5794220.1 glycogen debranching protein GlgX [Haemophilus parainfluenzae]OBX69521.1 glycogen debranching enzyme GlgX [Haemophilus parainfluenzae]